METEIEEKLKKNGQRYFAVRVDGLVVASDNREDIEVFLSSPGEVSLGEEKFGYRWVIGRQPSVKPFAEENNSFSTQKNVINTLESVVDQITSLLRGLK